ncbi:hypothetical protein Pcinc_030269 [Petrolisthes cinctipes]|uniref:Uncharacterized protein n=1 Tax=Petrolisthes cinctipes TaxID=88211 RepID=A0AAE1K697_PETCI|nr:hypothetical protein Pcinc_030269 [Petrolisthes cinctipes]
MTDRRVFESLCMEPGTPGFSYDTELLVDVDRAMNFEEAVIRLTTKCNSILTQLHILGNTVEEFSVTAVRVDDVNENVRTKTGGRGNNRRPVVASFQPSQVSSTTEGRSVRVMERQWCNLKNKKYSGMVAVARLARSSIPRNGSSGRYSVQVLTQTLLYHIESHFMFQSFSPNLKRLPLPTDRHNNNDDTNNGGEYLVYLIYRIQPSKTLGRLMETDVTCSTKKTRMYSELDDAWPFEAALRKRRRHTSGESNLSSGGSSVSSNLSGGPTYLSSPTSTTTHHPDTLWYTPPQPDSTRPPLLPTPPTTTSPNNKKPERIGSGWTNWSGSTTVKTTGSRRGGVGGGGGGGVVGGGGVGRGVQKKTPTQPDSPTSPRLLRSRSYTSTTPSQPQRLTSSTSPAHYLRRKQSKQ